MQILMSNVKLPIISLPESSELINLKKILQNNKTKHVNFLYQIKENG